MTMQGEFVYVWYATPIGTNENDLLKETLSLSYKIFTTQSFTEHYTKFRF